MSGMRDACLGCLKLLPAPAAAVPAALPAAAARLAAAADSALPGSADTRWRAWTQQVG